MKAGVSCRVLPARPGAKVLDHAITSFSHVKLPRSALLSEGNDLERQDSRKALFHQIRRVSVGTLSLSMTFVATLRLSGYVAGVYSQRRRIATMKQNETTPIITFSTQHTPVIDALTQASILEAFANWTVGQFKAQSTNARIQGALACVFKETAIHFGQATMSELMDRCGWQGLYTHNQVCELALAQRGTSVAEGDTLVLCIRLVTELMLGRYTLPEPVDPTSLLSKHEIGVWEEAAKMVESVMALDERQRDDGFNTFLLPRCRQLVQATGQRMSYEAAKATPSIRSEILRLWEMTCIQDDVSWYVANTDLDRIMIFKQHSEAVKAVLPFLDQLLNESGGEAWTTAPFLNDNDWNKFLNGLESFGYPDTPGDQRMEAHDRGFLKRLPSTLLTKKNIVAVRCLLRLKPRDIISRH
ncbi:hypothetical protein BN1723_017004 [Verticillium longisporum]|uniref:Acyl-CoA oxidase C-terminal domain-containing protein n=1 Tax=Verticillium longisporum TaxID=100787 RepID=A0A0G4NRZ6_VERLO|nr:hypothetical protein BN1723_017004 [Verticillium longisporum]